MKEDEKAYIELIREVAQIEPDAAIYLATEAKRLSDFDYSGDLGCCFDWSTTPQGSEYWATIYFKLP